MGDTLFERGCRRNPSEGAQADSPDEGSAQSDVDREEDFGAVDVRLEALFVSHETRNEQVPRRSGEVNIEILQVRFNVKALVRQYLRNALTRSRV